MDEHIKKKKVIRAAVTLTDLYPGFKLLIPKCFS